MTAGRRRASDTIPRLPPTALVVDRQRALTLSAPQIFCGLKSMIVGLLAFYVNGNLASLGRTGSPADAIHGAVAADSQAASRLARFRSWAIR
jgi:hypothetical protein